MADNQYTPPGGRLARRSLKRRLNREDVAADLASRVALEDDRARLRAIRLIKLAAIFRIALITLPILAPMSVAWTGQAGFAMKVIGWTFSAALLYAAAYELTVAFCGWMYHEARSDGDSGLEYRVATWVFMLGSATQQWWHYSNHWHATPRAVTFSSMTVIGLVIWELYARLVHRRKLRADHLISTARPRVGLVRWVRFPRRSWTAWSLTIKLGYATIDQAWSAADQYWTARELVADQRSAGPRRKAGRGPLVRPDQSAEVTAVVRPDHQQPSPVVRAPALPAGGPPPVRTSPAPTSGGVPAGPARTAGPVGPAGTPQAQKTPVPPRAPVVQPTPSPVAAPSPVAPTAPGDPFTPTSVEMSAIDALNDRGERLNRTSVGAEVRKTTTISTTRAARLAEWGRDQNGGPQLKAVI